MIRNLASFAAVAVLAACGPAPRELGSVRSSRQGLAGQSGGSCQTASDCSGVLPMFCRICADGSNGCAHWSCASGQCQVATCETAAAPGCAQESDCGQGQSCQNGSCAACHTFCNMACVQGKSCQADANGCVSCQPTAPPQAPSCAQEADCAYGQDCQSGSCAACHTVCNMACGQGKSCQSDANGCVSCQPTAPSCAQETDCAYGQDCQSGSCATCPSFCNMACVQGSSCQADLNGCMSCQANQPVCYTDWDCGWFQACIGGQCQ